MGCKSKVRTYVHFFKDKKTGKRVAKTKRKLGGFGSK